MAPDRWRRLEEIFFAGLDRGPEERARLLAEAAAVDPELAREAAAMLAAHDSSEPLGVERLLLESGPDEGAVKLLRAGFDGIMAAALQETPARRPPAESPVPARAGSPRYRAWGLLRRYVLAAVLLAGLLLADSGPVRSRSVETVTRRPARTATLAPAVVEASDPGQAQGATVPVREPLARGTKRVHPKVASQPPAPPPEPETSRVTAPWRFRPGAWHRFGRRGEAQRWREGVPQPQDRRRPPRRHRPPPGASPCSSPCPPTGRG